VSALTSVYTGFTALWKGVIPAMAHGLTYGGLRIGLYTSIKDAMSGEDGTSFQQKISAGCASGGLAAAVTNPMELVIYSHIATHF
jgi:hypothetical protein